MTQFTLLNGTTIVETGSGGVLVLPRQATHKARTRPVRPVPAPTANPQRRDPTRTGLLRRAFVGQVRRRWASLMRDIRQVVGKEDAFGLLDNFRPLAGVFNVFCPTGEGGGIDPTCRPGETAGESLTTTPFKREQDLLAAAKSIKFTTDVIEEEPLTQFDEGSVLERMTQKELDEMESDLENIKESHLSSHMDEYDPDDHISASDKQLAAEDAGWGNQESLERAVAAVDLVDDESITEAHKESAKEALDDYYNKTRSSETGVKMVEGMAGHLRKQDLPESLADAVEGLKSEAETAVEDSIESFRETLVDEYRSSVESNYQADADRESYLRTFFYNQLDGGRFSGALTQRVWGVDQAGDAAYIFETSTGNQYKLWSRNSTEEGVPLTDLGFHDAAGSYRVTGAGGAREVFTEVNKAVVGFVVKHSPETLHFTAVEKSRQRLYDRLVKTVTKVLPEYMAVAVNVHGVRSYLVSKRGSLERIKDRFGAKVEVLVNIESDEEDDDPPVEWEDIEPEFNPDWFSKDGEWQRMVKNVRWRALTSPQKLEAFRNWLTGQLAQKIISSAPSTEDDWWRDYIAQAYQQGGGRAFDDVNKKSLHMKQGQVSDFYQGSRREFLRSAFGRPAPLERVKLLASRVHSDLHGVTEAMSTKMTRVLTEGLIKGLHPNKLATQLVQSVGLEKTRAIAIARTETIRAHAEGQLDAMEAMGVTRVGVMVEYATARDDKVCPLCEPLEGVVLTTREAHGMIPRHPMCRCAWKPAGLGEDQTNQLRTKSRIDKAIARSLKAERPLRSKRTIATQKRLSRWQGAGTRIAKKRPKSIVENRAAPMVLNRRDLIGIVEWLVKVSQ